MPFTRETLVRLMWFVLWSDPAVTSDDLLGGFLTWLKAMSLVCLVCWVAAWLVTGVKQGIDRPGPLVRLSRGGGPS